MRYRSLLPAFLLALLPALARAHDYWLDPGTFTPTPGKPFDVHLHVGDGFTSEGGRPFQKKLTLHFSRRSKSGSTDLEGREGEKPQLRLTLDKLGTHLICMDCDSRLIRLEATKFTHYLEEEGLHHVLNERKKLGESDKAGRERYWRCLKLAVRAGDKGDDTATKVVKQKLEIVPLSDPTGLVAGDKLRLRILFDGKALPDVQVTRHHRAGEKVTSKNSRTSASGEVEFALDQSGIALIRLVHMRRAVKDEEADWESFWAALTFAVGAKNEPGAK